MNAHTIHRLCFRVRLAALMSVWLTTGLFSQSDSVSHWNFGGYVKNLQNWVFTDQHNSLFNGGFFHNRLTIKWSPDSTWTFDAEVRNRLFYGEWVRFQPGWAETLDQDKGWVDLSFVPVDRPALIGSVVADRLWAQWQRGRWTVRLGRQRINWAVALTWNPNDWFNAWNFLDFDYEERPGADALRLQYRTGNFSSLDVAVSPARDKKQWIGAARFSGNLRQYDWQAQAGVYRNRLAAGLGWAGNLGQAGFKGEISVFHPLDRAEGTTSVSAAAGVDVTLGDSWYVNGGLLVNSRGSSANIDVFALNQSDLSPDNLMPGKISFAAGGSHLFTPLLTTSLTAVYSPNGQLTILIPTAAYSVAENWDVDLTGQLFWLKSENGGFKNALNWLFLRVRWSF